VGAVSYAVGITEKYEINSPGAPVQTLIVQCPVYNESDIMIINRTGKRTLQTSTYISMIA
jgi:hypothetical protein